MGKYDPLFRHLAAADAAASVEMTFDEIERWSVRCQRRRRGTALGGTTTAPTPPTCKHSPGSTPAEKSSTSTVTAAGCGSGPHVGVAARSQA